MADVGEYERSFRKAGLPMFIANYTAREDVFTRAVPFLALVFVAQMLGALNEDWSTGANVAAALGGLAILLSAFGVVNRVRGRRFFSIPQRVGRTELAAFVLIPAILPVVFGGQVRFALGTALSNLVLIAIVYGVVGYGVISIVRWSARRLFRQLAASLGALSRAVPLLLIFALVLFLTVEMWEVFAGVPDGFLITIGTMFILLGSAFLVARLPREVKRLENEAADGPPLDTRQRFNVGLVMFVGQALQVLVVSLAVGAFFVVFGLFAVDPSLQAKWSGHAVETIGPALDIFGERLQLTDQLVRVAAGIAAFSGLYYAVSALTDSAYREDFLDELTGEMRASFKARVEYLKLRPAS